MIRRLCCGDEGTGTILEGSPTRFCFVRSDQETCYLYDPHDHPDSVPGTIILAYKGDREYEFMRISNDIPCRWRVTGIKENPRFHTNHGEGGANNLFGKILSRDKDDVYYTPNYSDLLFNVYKSNVEKKVLEFLSNLQNVETEGELRALVWEFKYGSAVSEWIASPVNYLEKDSEETTIDIDGPPQINDIGVMVEINEKKFTFKTDQGELKLFSLISKENGNTIEQIEAKRGHWFYVFNRVKDTDKWRIVSKIRQK